MGMKKVSVTLDEEVLARARELVGARGLSAYVNETLRLELQGRRIDQWLAEAELRSGPIPPEIAAETERFWGNL